MSDISWYFNNYVRMPFHVIKVGLLNYWKWRKIIWKDRWWDYDYLLRILLFKLEDMEKNWVINTTTEDAPKIKKILNQLLDDLKWLLEADEFDMSYEIYEKERAKRADRFFTTLRDNYQKFWN